MDSEDHQYYYPHAPKDYDSMNDFDFIIEVGTDHYVKLEDLHCDDKIKCIIDGEPFILTGEEFQKMGDISKNSDNNSDEGNNGNSGEDKNDSDDDDINELPLVCIKNKNRFVTSHFPSSPIDDSFTAGFLEATDFFQYIRCYFSIIVAYELWPPKGEYEQRLAFKDGKLVFNHFWSKYQATVNCINKECNETHQHNFGAYEFYDSLDYNNRQKLYNWYKRNVNKK